MKRFLVCLLWLACGRPADAETRYVDLAGTAALPPFTNLLHAATNIQDAVDASVAGDVILVSPGTYSLPRYSVGGINILLCCWTLR